MKGALSGREADEAAYYQGDADDRQDHDGGCVQIAQRLASYDCSSCSPTRHRCPEHDDPAGERQHTEHDQDHCCLAFLSLPGAGKLRRRDAGPSEEGPRKGGENACNANDDSEADEPPSGTLADQVFPTAAEEFYARDWFYAFALCDFDKDGTFWAFTTAHYTSDVNSSTDSTNTYRENE